MRIFQTTGIKEAAVHILGAALGYGATLLLTTESENTIAFAELSAWWAALYFGFVFSVTLRSLPWLVAAYEGLLVIDVVLNLRLFYVEGAAAAPLAYAALAQLGLIFIISPILLNGILRRVLMESKKPSTY